MSVVCNWWKILASLSIAVFTKLFCVVNGFPVSLFQFASVLIFTINPRGRVLLYSYKWTVEAALLPVEYVWLPISVMLVGREGVLSVNSYLTENIAAVSGVCP